MYSCIIIFRLLSSSVGSFDSSSHPIATQQMEVHLRDELVTSLKELEIDEGFSQEIEENEEEEEEEFEGNKLSLLS